MCFLNTPRNYTFSCPGSGLSLHLKLLSFSIPCLSSAYSSSSGTTSCCLSWLLKAKFLNLLPVSTALMKLSTTVQKQAWDHVTGAVEVVRWQRCVFSIVLYWFPCSSGKKYIQHTKLKILWLLLLRTRLSSKSNSNFFFFKIWIFKSFLHPT